MKTKKNRLYTIARPSRRFVPVKHLEDCVPREDGKRQSDLVSVIADMKESPYQAPLESLTKYEHWRVITDFVRLAYADVPVELRDVVGLAQATYNALFTLIKESVRRSL